MDESVKNKLPDLIKKMKSKKSKRNMRINSISLSTRAALKEKLYNENNKNNKYNDTLKNQPKINRSTKLVQNNVLTNSRSSFVKSSLKP